MGMKSTADIGMKITSRMREYYRYTGVSAELEKRGSGCSRPELAWVHRHTEQLDSETEERSPKAIRENMQKIQASNARTHFYSILDSVEGGKSVLVTRNGKVIARIEPLPSNESPGDAVAECARRDPKRD
jgi:antitoxin (DNA-binding transcriptional repressor) of toxin-antitoxin stability system